MAKHTIDFDDYDESRGGYNGEQPKPGLYNARLVSVGEHTAKSSGAEGFVWAFELTDAPYAGFRGYVYSNVSTTKWRTQEIILAITGGKKEGFVLDTDKADRIVAKAKPVKIRTKYEKYEGEDKTRFASIIPLTEASKAPAKPAAPAASDPWDEDDDEDDED